MSDKSRIFYRIRRKCQVLACYVAGPVFMSKVYFRHKLGYCLNLSSPKTFNEKLQWLKLYYWPENKLAVQCADKFRVREYVKSIGRDDLLNDIIATWDNVDEIDWDTLPDQFVIKCNHGCGYNIICSDKSKANRAAVIHQLNKWMKENFALFNAEPHYGKIPKKIICEKFLGERITNYNIYCFNGKATFFSLASGLGGGVNERLTYYYPCGSKAEFKNRAYQAEDVELSSNLSLMLLTAEEFAKDFPMVRVDFYDIDGKIILSELTFTPGGALIPISPYKSNLKLGEMLDIGGSLI